MEDEMASQEDLRTIAGKALADPAFREKLLADPESAVTEAGIELTPEQMEALKGMDREQLEAGLADLDERLTMGCWAKANTPVGTVCAWR
jgi:hypothetical protein